MFYNIIKVLKKGFVIMDRIVSKLKAWGWVFMIIFTIIGFVQMLLTLNPRVTDLETRVAKNENKISAIEVKLDTLIAQGSETHKDVKDIYHLILETHR